MQTITLTERVPAPDTGSLPFLLIGALVLGGGGLLVAAFPPLPLPFLLAVLLLAGAEIPAALRARFLTFGLGRFSAGAPFRVLVGGIGLLVLLVRSDAPPGWTVGTGFGLLCLYVLQVVGIGLAGYVRQRRKQPMVTRGLDLGPLRVPPAPPTPLSTYAETTFPWPAYVGLLGGALSVLTGSVVWLVVGFGLGVAAGLAGVAVLARALLALRQVPWPRYRAAVERALEKLRPEVVLYFASGPETAYQLEMWLAPLERIRQPVLVILRDRELFRTLGPTRLPVLCVEHGGPLMGLRLPSLRLALYPSHAVGNLHLLRRRGVVHTFIGHGDSDKPVSSNPFLKAYDQIWVSGPAGRERMRDADIGIHDPDDPRLAEIGRPQIEATTGTTESERVTVLYAPTWEGYDDQPHQSSVESMGVELVQRLLAEPDVRVLYRPHPLLGSRDVATRAAHLRILDLLGGRMLADRFEFPDPYARARDELDVAGVLADQSRSELVAARAVWAGKQLAGTEHRLVPDPPFALLDCFAAADVLLSDVSSVITDFLVTGKPFGVTNPAGLPEDEFVVRYPSSRGGYLVTPATDGVTASTDGLTRLLSAARGAADPAAPGPADAAEWLLGPAEPPAAERLQRAVDAALAQTRNEPPQ